MFEAHHFAVTALLREHRLVDEEQLDAALSDHEATGRPVAEIVLNQGAITMSALLTGVADHLHCEVTDDLPSQLPGDAVNAVPGDLARTYGVAGPVDFLEFKLEPGWRLMRRAFAGKRLGHIYVYRESWPSRDTAAASAPEQVPQQASVNPEPVATPPTPEQAKSDLPQT